MSSPAKTLTEHEAKALLSSYGVPVTREVLAHTREEALRAAREIGFPVVLKGSGQTLAHKTDLGLVRVGLSSEEEVARAVDEWSARNIPGLTGYLVQERVPGNREVLCGLSRDPQFGPVVAFGLGGVQAEMLRDLTFRVCPIEERDALEMLDEIHARRILENFRGEPPVDRPALARVLLALSRIGTEREDVLEIDVNPVLFREGAPVAADALVRLR